jgi:hypothetical protein
MERESQAVLTSVRIEKDLPFYARSLKVRYAKNVKYILLFPELHHLWYTFTFNPSLRRTSDYRELPGGYQGVGNEIALSLYYKRRNRDMAWLIGGGVRHIGVDRRSNYGNGRGYGRVSANRLVRFFRRETVRKWLQSLRRRFWHGLRLFGIDTEPYQRQKR